MNTFNLSRRSFVKGGAASALGLTAAGVLAGCVQSMSKNEKPSDATEKFSIEETKETDIVVVGLGASGLMAALAAADKGASVIAIDSALSFEGTTNTHTTGAWMIESKEQVKHDGYLTQQ